MSRTPEEISTAIRATLAATEPGLSCERGTPERKIIDACAEAISEGYVDMYLVGSLMDIDNKVGLELEQWVGIFGFGRLQGKKATGVVRLTVNAPLPRDQLLPLGVQFFTKSGADTAGGERLYFASTQAVTLTAGSYTVDVPVQCSEYGTKGNVAPNSITNFGSTIAASTVTNLVAFTGGVDKETDPELRQRFKDTLLRNIAGTSDWYRALALKNKSVSRVAVYGPTNLYRTQIEAPDTAVRDLSTVIDPSIIKYVWDGQESVFVNLAQADEQFYHADIDYTFSWPDFARVATGSIKANDILDFEFQYTPAASRNDPANGITNKVDVFVDGVDPYTVTERTTIRSVDTVSLTDGPSSEWNSVSNFERDGSEGEPQPGSRFVRLVSVPVLSVPPTITVGSDVYKQGEDYHLLRSITPLAGSSHEVSGLEWPSGKGPADDAQLTLTYLYNRVPEVLQAVVNTSKQICTDVMIHQARWRYVTPCLAVRYNRSYSPTVVDASIKTQLTRYFSAMEYGVEIRITPLLMAVQQVLGVDSVTLITDDALPHYGVEIASTATGNPTHEITDFRLPDNALPVLQDVRITRKAEM